MILKLVSSEEDPLRRSMDTDFSCRKHDAKTLLKQIFVYHNLEINCKVKYLCYVHEQVHETVATSCDKQFTYILQSRVPVERTRKSYEGNKLEHCTRIDVDEWNYRSAYCPSLKYVNGVKLEVMGTQEAVATSGADDEGSREEKLVYYANFLLRHGATRALLAGMEDFPSIRTGRDEGNTLSVELEKMMGSMMLKYALRTFQYCQECDSFANPLRLLEIVVREELPPMQDERRKERKTNDMVLSLPGYRRAPNPRVDPGGQEREQKWIGDGAMKEERQLFTTKGHTPAAFRISKENVATLCTSLDKLQNLTYASKIVFGLADMATDMDDEYRVPRAPLIGAGGLCPNPVLSYWILLVTLQRSHKQEVNISILPRLATTLKHLWFKLSPSLFSLKLHALLDHAIGENLQRYGTPNHWSSASFESNHMRMQLRIAQSTTHFGGSLMRGFLLEKELRMMLSDVADEHQNPIMTSLLKEISSEGVTGQYWSRPSDTVQDCVAIAQGRSFAYGRVVAFVVLPDKGDGP
ncbi:unnamed protein product [Heligmosomoides polygyrus]|uniref:E3 ubiquitin-protein ligase n=1 Tax=Heligmosomoides polygyrus TaxID=6339 RepID=A0A183GBX7_HELPZ|nr:unnamed protein product [Heligmosomoides polygyrus]